VAPTFVGSWRADKRLNGGDEQRLRRFARRPPATHGSPRAPHLCPASVDRAVITEQKTRREINACAFKPDIPRHSAIAAVHRFPEKRA
jgi:hypothetical protein